MKVFEHLLLLSAFWCGANSAFAQTWTQTSAPTNSWRCVASSADGSKLVAAVNFGGIYISTNSGVTWETTSAMYAPWVSTASSADGTKLAAAPAYGFIYLSTNSGATWKQSGAPLRNWVSIASSADGSKLVAASYLGSIYRSTDSGTTWTANTNLVEYVIEYQPKVATNAIPVTKWQAVVSSADGTKMTAVTGFSGIYITTNSGVTWIQSRAPNDYEEWFCAASSADGSKLIAAEVPSTYVSANSGMTWGRSDSPDELWASVASSADGNKLVLISSYESNVISGDIYSSADSGATWISNAAPKLAWASVASSADGSKLVAASNGGGIWTLQTKPVPQLNLAPLGSNLTVSWIIPSTIFVLQQNLDLSTTNWTGVTNPPVLNLANLRNEVILRPPGSNVFYRLKTP